MTLPIETSTSYAPRGLTAVIIQPTQGLTSKVYTCLGLGKFYAVLIISNSLPDCKMTLEWLSFIPSSSYTNTVWNRLVIESQLVETWLVDSIGSSSLHSSSHPSSILDSSTSVTSGIYRRVLYPYNQVKIREYHAPKFFTPQKQGDWCADSVLISNVLNHLHFTWHLCVDVNGFFPFCLYIGVRDTNMGS